MTPPFCWAQVRRTGWLLLDWTSRQWRHAVTARAMDGGALCSGPRLLVLAPHPDDETFGCGGTIARARAAGAPVDVVVATDGRHSTVSTVYSPDRLAALRLRELCAACQALGVNAADVLLLGFEDGTLAYRQSALTQRLIGVLAERRPDVLLIPCAQDDHPDHRALHRAALRATESLVKPPAVLAYPLWTWAQAPWFGAAGWRRRLPLLAWSLRQLWARRWVRVTTAMALAAKRAAVAEHASQTTNLTGETAWSYLPPEFCALFLQPTEVFLRLSAYRGGAPR